MLSRALQPHPNLASLVLRLGLAAIFTVHGYIKAVMTNQLIHNLDYRLQTVVGWLELVIGFALAVGLLSRVSAAILIVLQSGAIVMVTGKNAFAGPTVHKWGADYSEVGPEFNMVLMVMSLAVIVLGSGTYSLDHLITRRRQRTATAARSAAPVA